MLPLAMRFSALALALLLTACGGDDAPTVVETTDVTVATDAPETDTVVVVPAGDGLPDASTMEASDAPAASAPAPDAARGAAPPDAGPSPDTESGPSVGMWAGDPPVTADGTHFVAVPPVRAKLEEAFGVEPGLLATLSNLDDEPHFLTTPIESVGSMLGLTFTPNPAFGDGDRTLYLLVADDASRVFALLTAPNGDTFYRASYDASGATLPAAAAAWMSRKGGLDFAEMVRENDETEIGP